MPNAKMNRHSKEINGHPRHPMPWEIENGLPHWKRRWPGWRNKMKSSSSGYLSHLIQRSIQTGILRSRRIRTTPPMVEATKMKANVIDKTTTKVTIAV
ncbi:hypothetical protein FH972_002314 [Carpinus fangiana]|uniref:Uncharacterized protein n=1 Tax=Carpinus fangiana TaxID=176857 RepID=A0A5N6QEU9_9ROSI|nr:hypothetical protein FH972_002314 [Carpinus fangiana]